MDFDLFATRGLPWDQRPSIADLINAGDCWEWKGGLSVQGYAITTVGRRQWKAYRLVWSVLVGEIPEGMTLDHLCRNRACVNPDHLEIVSVVENVMRGYSPQAKHARKTRCVRGHPLTQGKLQRHCRTCKNESHRRYRAEGKPT